MVTSWGEIAIIAISAWSISFLIMLILLFALRKRVKAFDFFIKYVSGNNDIVESTNDGGILKIKKLIKPLNLESRLVLMQSLLQKDVIVSVSVDDKNFSVNGVVASGFGGGIE